MRSHFERLRERLQGISWENNNEHGRSQARLVQEYLRRSALWAQKLGKANWPFYDVAEIIEPEVRAPEKEISSTLNSIPEGGTYYTRKTMEWSLQFAHLNDAREINFNLPDPYDPLIRVYERGDFINYTPVGYIEVGVKSVPRGKMEKYASITPLLDISDAKLQEIDERR